MPGCNDNSAMAPHLLFLVDLVFLEPFKCLCHLPPGFKPPAVAGSEVHRPQVQIIAVVLQRWNDLGSHAIKWCPSEFHRHDSVQAPRTRGQINYAALMPLTRQRRHQMPRSTPSALFTMIAFTTLAAIAPLGGCDTTTLAVNSTAKVLEKAQPSIRMESDYEMAARAIPASLKTVEGFHIAVPENKRLVRILAEGYCQYANGFIEDEWELALIAKDFEDAEYQSSRATKAYFRCMNYGLELLGKKWQETLFLGVDELAPLLAKTDTDDRFAMLWVAVGLGGSINQNKADIAMVAHAPKARMILQRILELDAKKQPTNLIHAAFPHIAMALLKMALSPALGGKPEEGKAHLEKALAITHGKFLLPKVLLARRYAVATQDRALFHNTLVEVLQTDPAIWPEQRLANELAHRRARRYLKLEKELF